MRSRPGKKLCAAAGFILLLLSGFSAIAAAEDFRPYGSIKLEYEEETEKDGDEKVERSIISQEYELGLDGYIWRRDFMIFQSAVRYDESMEDDSDAGDSRDRDIDFYDITLTILPEWMIPTTLHTKKNVIKLDSDDSEDTENVEDTYRIETQLLREPFPELEFEFERIDEKDEETDTGVTTTESQRDSYEFRASDVVAGNTQLKFEYLRDEDRDQLEDTEDVSNTYIFSAVSEFSSKLRMESRLEYNDNNQESSTVPTTLAIREDVDSVLSVSFRDATANDIADDIAVPLTLVGDPDFTDWDLAGFTTTIQDVNNNQITFDDPIPDDVFVVIEYQTGDGTIYHDIYLGNDTSDTFPLKVTKVIITDAFDDYLVLSEYYSIAGGEVNLDFSSLTEPEPIDSAPFPLTGVDVTIVYNTRSGNHFEDEFLNVDIQQNADVNPPDNVFVLSRVTPGQDEEILFEFEVGYLPIPALDLNMKYEFDRTKDDQETVTENKIETTVKTAFFTRFLTTTEFSYRTETTDFSLNPDVVGDPEDQVSSTTAEEWDFSHLTEYSYPLSWTTLIIEHEFEYELREEDLSPTTETITNTLDIDFLLGRTEITNEFEYEIENKEDTEGNDTQATEFTYEFKAENKRRVRGAALTTTLEYKLELDTEDDQDDFTKSTYLFEEEIQYGKVDFETSLEYTDEEKGDEFTKELESDTEIEYKPFNWLELSSGLNWVDTQTEEEDSTETDIFLEAEFDFNVGRSGTLEFGARQEWHLEDPGENEDTVEFDAKFTYTYAEVKATIEVDYERSNFDGESDDTEDYGFLVSLERQF